jgi:hypothetical protein
MPAPGRLIACACPPLAAFPPELLVCDIYQLAYEQARAALRIPLSLRLRICSLN